MNPLLKDLQDSILPAAKVFESIEREQGIRFVLLGGAAVPFFVDPAALTSYRKTKDIDVVVATANYPDFIRIENLLRTHGFINDLECGRSPLEQRLQFRWWLGDTCIDILSTHNVRMGNDVQWLGEKLENSSPLVFHDGTRIWLAKAPAFVAMKLDAFMERGKSDFLESRDLEDILTVIHGRPAFEDEMQVADSILRDFVVGCFSRFLSNDEFLTAVAGQFPHSPGEEAKLIERIKRLIM